MNEFWSVETIARIASKLQANIKTSYPPNVSRKAYYNNLTNYLQRCIVHNL